MDEVAAFCLSLGLLVLPNYDSIMSFDDSKLIINRNRPDGWVVEIPARRRALMRSAEEAVTELQRVAATRGFERIRRIGSPRQAVPNGGCPPMAGPLRFSFLAGVTSDRPCSTKSLHNSESA